MFYRRILKPLFFLFPAERAHYLAMGLLRLTLNVPGLASLIKGMLKVPSKGQNQELWGLSFRNGLGMAAGFDKDGRFIRELDSLGFGFVELGTVTPLPQNGNPKPRLFRLKKDEAIINRMGFNNRGVENLKSNIENFRRRFPNSDLIIGGNIGKNKQTPNADAKKDYIVCFKSLRGLVDYYVVNVSSPNTPGLRELQEKSKLMDLLKSLQEINTDQTQAYTPLLLKIAPDLGQEALKDIMEVAERANLDGLVISNTTIQRENLQTSPQHLEKIGNGGLSGAPIKERAEQMLREVRREGGPQLKLIGVGGIASVQDAKERFSAGADLVQIYSGFIYRGPKLIKEILKN